MSTPPNPPNPPNSSSEKSLPPEAFRRYDESPDDDFYLIPRLVTHIDDAAIAAVTDLYRERFPEGGDILDLMSSWVSHLPPEATYRRVAGLGMNQNELAANPRLSEYTVQSLNDNPRLPYEDNSFDGCGICVSIQYLTDPVTVLRDVGRVLRPGSPIVITFSNRCFPTKAVAIWQRLDDRDHCRLVAHYLDAADRWENIEMLDRTPPRSARGKGDPLFAVVATRQA